MPLPPLTADAVAPFITVLRAVGGRFTDVPAVLEPGDVPGHHAFAILCPQPVDPTNVVVTALERHPHSTQTFLPLKAGRWIVLFAPSQPDGAPDTGRVQAFVAGPEDGICIARNVWHAGLTVLDRAAEMGMIMWRADAGDDGVLHELATPIVLDV